MGRRQISHQWMNAKGRSDCPSSCAVGDTKASNQQPSPYLIAQLQSIDYFLRHPSRETDDSVQTLWNDHVILPDLFCCPRTTSTSESRDSPEVVFSDSFRSKPSLMPCMRKTTKKAGVELVFELLHSRLNTIDFVFAWSPANSAATISRDVAGIYECAQGSWVMGACYSPVLFQHLGPMQSMLA